METSQHITKVKSTDGLTIIGRFIDFCLQLWCGIRLCARRSTASSQMKISISWLLSTDLARVAHLSWKSCVLISRWTVFTSRNGIDQLTNVDRFIDFDLQLNAWGLSHVNTLAGQTSQQETISMGRLLIDRLTLTIIDFYRSADDYRFLPELAAWRGNE